MNKNDFVKVRVNGRVEEIPRKWYETTQIFCGIERQVLSCLDENLPTEKTLQRLDAIRQNNAKYFGREDWEIYVTSLINEKEERRKAIDEDIIKSRWDILDL